MEVVKQSEWINIPKIYFENVNMQISLLPLIVVGLIVPTLSGSFDSAVEDSSLSSTLDISSAMSTITQWLQQSPKFSSMGDLMSQIGASSVGKTFNTLMNLITTELPPQLQFSIDTVVDFVSILLLIRLAKIIGSDRDRVIASKLQTFCEEFPNSEIVAVVGMLHCNGVARYLVSGKKPLQK